MMMTSTTPTALSILRIEYQAFNAAVRYLEERIASGDEKLDRMALKSELVDLKDQVAHLTERVAQLEKALN